MHFTLGFSPCPNDTFIFDALVNKKIDTQNFTFEVVLDDVQTLNQWALQGKLNITKISYGVLPLLLNRYAVLNSGSALGQGVGPLLISKNKIENINVNENLIAIPGKNTTAHLLFSLAFPHAKNKIFLRFDEIENFVQSGKGLGVIIHENRFTYQKNGLHKIMDLGNFWEQKTNCYIPLGGIVIDKNIDKLVQQKMDLCIKQSIEYAIANYPTLPKYVKQHAQEMEEAVMRNHIDLYVNEYSLNLGKKGIEAINQLLLIYEESNQVVVDKHWLI